MNSGAEISSNRYLVIRSCFSLYNEPGGDGYITTPSNRSFPVLFFNLFLDYIYNIINAHYRYHTLLSHYTTTAVEISLGGDSHGI